MLILNWESSNTTYDFKRKKEVAAEVWEVTNPDVRVKVDNTIPIIIGVCVVIIIIIISICCCKKRGKKKKKAASQRYLVEMLRLVSSSSSKLETCTSCRADKGGALSFKKSVFVLNMFQNYCHSIS